MRPNEELSSTEQPNLGNLLIDAGRKLVAALKDRSIGRRLGDINETNRCACHDGLLL